MKLEKFIEIYDGAPIDIKEFAYAASKVSDSIELAEAAKLFLESIETFEFVLEKHITIG